MMNTRGVARVVRNRRSPTPFYETRRKKRYDGHCMATERRGEGNICMTTLASNRGADHVVWPQNQ